MSRSNDLADLPSLVAGWNVRVFAHASSVFICVFLLWEETRCSICVMQYMTVCSLWENVKRHLLRRINTNK